MSQPNQTDDRQVKAAEVNVGDFTYDSKSGAPVEVTHVQPFKRRGNDLVLIVTADADAVEHDAGDPIWVVGPANLAHARARRERADRIADIRAMADWLADNPNIPMPHVHSFQHSMISGGDDQKRALAASVAALLGAEVREDADGNLTVRKAIVRPGEYRSIDYVLHGEVTPAQSIEDAPQRGTDAAEQHAPKPATVEGHGHQRNGDWHDEEAKSDA